MSKLPITDDGRAYVVSGSHQFTYNQGDEQSRVKAHCEATRLALELARHYQEQNNVDPD